MAHLMPFRKEKSAPFILNEANPGHELFRYISDLEQLFALHRVTMDSDKKKWFTYYPGIDIAEFWECLPEYESGKTYSEFKAAVLKHYPDADADRLYERQDLNQVIMHYAGAVDSLAELAAYYRDFYPKAQHLVAKNRLSIHETGPMFSQGFTPVVFDSIIRRLQIKLPDHHPADPYDLSDIYSAAQFILQGTNRQARENSPPGCTSEIPVPIRPSALYPSSDCIPIDPIPFNIEQNQSEVKPELIDGLIKLSETLLQLHANHYLQQAPQTPVQVFAQSRPVRRCQFCGKLGHRLRDCYDMRIMVQAGKCCWNHEKKIVLPTGAPITPELPGTCLQDRINAWHHQLASSSVFVPIPDPIASTTPVLSCSSSSSSSSNFVPISVHIAGSTRQSSPSTPLLPPGLLKPQTPAIDDAVPVPNPKQHLEELIARSHAMTTEIESPQSDIDGVISSNEPSIKPTPSYSISLHDSKLETASTRELNRPISPIFNQCIPHCSEPIINPSPLSAIAESIAAASTPDFNGVNSPELEPPTPRFRTDPEIPPKSAPESIPIRAIYPIVNGKFRVQSIIDSGSQIVSMSEATCHQLGLGYDPAATIDMQAANGSITRSLGLARNVPICIGNITFYLQIHIFRESGPYIILGRPFDVLTRSIVQNYANGTQIMRIHDPNTGRMVLIPTIHGGLSTSHYRSSRRFHHRTRRKKKWK